MYQFNVDDATKKCVLWIRDFFEKNGKGCNAVVGISGGKDSSVVAALLKEALGQDRVIGVLLPNGVQDDIDVARDVCKFLGIKAYEINIKQAFEAATSEVKKHLELTEQTIINIQPRLRMTLLYAVSQSVNGRVANTCNLSEDWVGYSTRYGDSVGDFSPLSNFTVTEVRQIGRYLNLPSHIIEKVPTDGISGKTDEDKLGFTYEDLDMYIREGKKLDSKTQARIDYLHELNKFKLELMPAFQYQGE